MGNPLNKFGRRLFFPGFDVHTRSRAALCQFWKTGARRVLDAGFGNGYFSYLAWKTGANVDAVSFECDSVIKATDFFKKQVRAGKIKFIYSNLYDVTYPSESFDEIICYETLEHLMRDQKMVCRFSKWLKPGGFLHLCVPNKLHPDHAGITPSPTEDGWHVRHGYDTSSLREILARADLKAELFTGVGHPVLCACDNFVRLLRNLFGDLVASPCFLLTWPVWPWFCLTAPATGYSIYVKAVKRADQPNGTF
jgi:SAM-dependent methyltransferase